MGRIYDEKFENSTGIFADPVTFEALSVETPRTTTCPDANTFVWPKVKGSDGKEYRLASKLWNRVEKDAYNNYRGGTGKSSGTRTTKIEQHVDVAKIDALDEFLATVLKGEDLEKAKKFTKALRPVDPEVLRVRNAVMKMSEEQKALFLAMLKPEEVEAVAV